MIAIVKQAEVSPMIVSELAEHCGECSRQLADAKRELAAFLQACKEMFGSEVAGRAAECWIGLVESARQAGDVGPHYWRQFSILAASRMETDYALCLVTTDATGMSRQ